MNRINAEQFGYGYRFYLRERKPFLTNIKSIYETYKISYRVEETAIEAFRVIIAETINTK